ncbi:MAG: DUF1320 domain-containing protein [Pseudophaeobacter sp.]|jgi:phage gp36-like protein|uniref:gp436 family protein n=1 Tax=Pseudophaeobacter sp. TaxID=1971739 RepID=UPI0032D95BE9
MPYTSQDQLVTRFGKRLLVDLTDRADAPTGEIDTQIVDSAIASAQALIDGFLVNHYALPLDEVPELISSLSEALVIYDLHVYEAPEKIESAEKSARKTLAQIGEGKIGLPISGNEPATKSANDVRFTKRERPITAKSTTGFI